MQNIYIVDLKKKIEKILNIFSKNYKELKPIVNDMHILGFQYKSYVILDSSIQRIESYLKLGGGYYTPGGAAVKLYKKLKLEKHAVLPKDAERSLKNYKYQQRREVWRLLNVQGENEALISIDFNHHYLNQMCKQLPLEVESKNKKTDLKMPGFYEISYFIEEGQEILLPTKNGKETLYYSGYGRGVYGNEEINYFLKEGMQLLKIRPHIVYKKTNQYLRGMMEQIHGMPERHARKSIANQFFGRMGQESGNHTNSILTLAEYIENPLQAKRAQHYGYFVLVENFKINTRITLKRLDWALCVEAYARIELNKLLKLLLHNGAKIYFVNVDEIIISKNTLPLVLKNAGYRPWKIKNLNDKDIEQLRNQQGDLLHKRRSKITNPVQWVSRHKALASTL